MNTHIPKKVLYELSKKVCQKEFLSDLTDADKHAIAMQLHAMGFKYMCSSFEDMPTYGYGELDNWGFWEYPLYEKDVHFKPLDVSSLPKVNANE